MNQRPRIYYTEGQKALMWERGQKGEPLAQIAKVFDRGHSSIQPILAATGGIRPARRSRSRFALTLAERASRGGRHGMHHGGNGQPETGCAGLACMAPAQG